MAALERRVPCLDDFLGQSWSGWAERINLSTSDGSDGDDCSKNGKKTTETMTLRKEDMSIFGHYPGHDEFYLVVCSHCSQVVKPQAFEKHCERRHGSIGKLYAHLRPTATAVQQRSHARHGHAPSAGSHGTTSWSGKSQGGGGTRPSPQSPSTPPQFKHTKTSKDVRASPLEKTSTSAHSESTVFKQPPPIEPPRSSPPPGVRDPPWPYGGPSPGRPSPASTEKSPSQRAEPGSASTVPSHARGSRPHKMSKKECDLDRHCGVLDPERKKVCTRLLTCNIHSIHQRRKVVGRSKNFDQLVAELKMGSKNRERGTPSHEGPTAQSPSPETPRETRTEPLCRKPLTNSPAFRTRTVSESAPEEERAVRDECSARASSPLTQGRISSDESEGEGADEPADWHSSPWHPKPLAVCTFGSFALGHGVFTFDRRLHHLRSAMSAMVENHLSAHLWKKIPQASEPQSQSSSAKPSAISTSSSLTSHHSKQRAGNSTSRSSSFSSQAAGRDVSSSSRSSAQSEKSGGSQSSAHSKPSQTASQTGPGRPKNPVGRPSKQQRLREAERAEPKRKASSQSETDAISSDRNCVSPDRDRDRARMLGSGKSVSAQISTQTPTSSHGQTNGSLSPAHKQSRAESWPFKRTHTAARSSPPEPGASGRTGNSGHHGSRPPGHEHRGLGKKRKSSDSSPPSKAHRLPTNPHSGFYPWKESKGAPLPIGGEKKLSAPKPKLHR